MHVPYKGSALAIQDVIDGQIPMMFDRSGSGAIYVFWLRQAHARAAVQLALWPNLRQTNEQMSVIDFSRVRFALSVTQGKMNAEEDLVFHESITDAMGYKFFRDVLESRHDALFGFMRPSIGLTR